MEGFGAGTDAAAGAGRRSPPATAAATVTATPTATATAAASMTAPVSAVSTLHVAVGRTVLLHYRPSLCTGLLFRAVAVAGGCAGKGRWAGARAGAGERGAGPGAGTGAVAGAVGTGRPRLCPRLRLRPRLSPRLRLRPRPDPHPFVRRCTRFADRQLSNGAVLRCSRSCPPGTLEFSGCLQGRGGGMVQDPGRK